MCSSFSDLSAHGCSAKTCFLFSPSCLSRSSSSVFSGRWNDKTKKSERIYPRSTLTNVILLELETSFHWTNLVAFHSNSPFQTAVTTRASAQARENILKIAAQQKWAIQEVIITQNQKMNLFTLCDITFRGPEYNHFTSQILSIFSRNKILFIFLNYFLSFIFLSFSVVSFFTVKIEKTRYVHTRFRVFEMNAFPDRTMAPKKSFSWSYYTPSF